jgi:uncharacterized membrane-anchored protein YitT (DUF2179 family)
VAGIDGLTLAKRIIGLASVTLGVAALISPQRLAQRVGVYDQDAPEAMAAFGAKEIAAGAALLAPVRPGPFLWARVAADVVNVGGLVVAFRKPGAHRTLLTLLAGGAVAAIVVDLVTAGQAMREGR